MPVLEAEEARLNKEIANLDQQLNKIAGLLNNPGFINKAPENVVAREKNREVELGEKKAQLVQRLRDLGG